MADGTYTAHEVAVILADAFGDDCACNFNSNDEWLPYLCELRKKYGLTLEAKYKEA